MPSLRSTVIQASYGLASAKAAREYMLSSPLRPLRSIVTFALPCREYLSLYDLGELSWFYNDVRFFRT
jgi:hypothetical protein